MTARQLSKKGGELKCRHLGDQVEISGTARPKAERKYPAVIVIHENRGLQPHIMDVNRRMASEGFLSLAPDALSPFCGTPETSLPFIMKKFLDSGFFNVPN